MKASPNGLTWLWRWMGKVPYNPTVEGLFWRLPFASQRLIVRTFRINVGIPRWVISEVLKRKSLFVHVPKTAGISLQFSLFGRGLFKHQTYRHYELLMDEDVLASLFKFTFVRNPWDRLVSAWTYLRENGLGYSSIEREGGNWFLKHLSRYDDFEDFVLRWVTRKNVQNAFIHLKPQVHFLKNSRGQIDMDYIGRFEDLSEHFERLAERMGRPASLEFRNRTQTRQRSSYRDYYSPKTVEVVAKAYEDDVRTFGYEF